MLRFIQIAALLASMLVGSVYAQADFAWEINPENGYPIIAFDQDNADSEVVFRYNYTGTTSENKYLEAKLYQDDCVTAADDSLDFIDLIDGSELQLDVDIIQSTITDSVHYSATSDTTANIAFCVRVDYNYKDSDGEVMSINFHETTVDITVDLTANFTLTGISTDRTAADQDQANAELDYPVEAYFCVDDNSEVVPDPFTQGGALQVCVKIDDEIVTEEVYVEDILRFVVTQPEGPATASVNIADGTPDPLTSKACGADGVCNVKTQLPSKYFVEPSPNDLRVDGMALLAFGNPAGRVRKLRARIQGTLPGSASDSNAVSAESDRQLQAGGENPFSLEVGLVSDVPTVQEQAPPAAAPASGSNNTIIIAAVIAVFVMLLILMVVGISVYCCCFKGGAAGGGKSRQQEFEEEERIRRMYAAKMGSSRTACSDDYDKECARSGQMPAQFS